MKRKKGEWALWTLTLAGLAILTVLSLSGSLSASGGIWGGDDRISKAEQQLDELFFPKDKVIDVNILIDEEQFQDLLDNAIEEQYKQATVVYNGVTFENVAVRAKGNLSLNSVVRMADSDRYSFKISFDEYVSQTMGGLSKVNLNNGYSDASYIREFLSYELAESMGLPVPKYSFVNVYVNDELWGFYLAVEQIGDAYLTRHFGDSGGALYKANGGSGSELNWLETIDAYTGLDAKQGRKGDDELLAMLDELNNGSDYASFINIEHALGYFALNVATGNMDSYHSDKKHNYYLYGDNGVFSILAWDYNMSFGGFGGTSILIDEPTTVSLASRPLIANLLSVDEYKTRYHSMLQTVIDGYLSEESFQARTEQLDALISDYVQADPSSFVTYEQYKQGIEQLRSYNSEQILRIARQLDGTMASSGDGSGSGFGGGFGGGAGFGGQGGRGNAFGGGRGADNGAVPGNEQSDAANGARERWAPPVEDGTVARASRASAEAAGTAGGSSPAMGGNGAQQGGSPTDGNGMQGGALPDSDGNGAQGGAFPPTDNNEAQDGFPPMGGNEAPDGFGRQGGMMWMEQGGMPDGINGPMGNFPGRSSGSTVSLQENTSEAIMTAISAAVLLIACLIVAFYRRSR